MRHAGVLAKVQVVAPVVNAERPGIPDDWDGAYNFAPLPDLLGDGAMHAVDLRAASNIDGFFAGVLCGRSRGPAFPHGYG